MDSENISRSRYSNNAFTTVLLYTYSFCPSSVITVSNCMLLLCVVLLVCVIEKIFSSELFRVKQHYLRLVCTTASCHWNVKPEMQLLLWNTDYIGWLKRWDQWPWLTLHITVQRLMWCFILKPAPHYPDEIIEMWHRLESGVVMLLWKGLETSHQTPYLHSVRVYKTTWGHSHYMHIVVVIGCDMSCDLFHQADWTIGADWVRSVSWGGVWGVWNVVHCWVRSFQHWWWRRVV